MTYHKLGKKEEAIEWLKKCRDYLPQKDEETKVKLRLLCSLFEICTPRLEVNKNLRQWEWLFQWISLLSKFIWNPYTLCGRFRNSLGQGECESQVDKFIEQL